MSEIRRKRSSVWMYFTPILGSFNAKCHVCSHEISYRGRATSNLAKHIKARHPSLASEMPDRKKLRESADISVTSETVYTLDSYPEHTSATTKNATVPVPSVATTSTTTNKTATGSSIANSAPQRKMMEKRSYIWMHFTQIFGTFKATCNICSHEISYRGRSTSNLAKHLKARHPSASRMLERKKLYKSADVSVKLEIDMPDYPQHTPPTTSATVSEPSAVTTSAPNWRTQERSSTTDVTRVACSLASQKRLNRLILNLVTRDLQSFSIVEDIGFRELLCALDPSYMLPTKHTLTKDLMPAAYNDAVSWVKTELLKAEAVCLTIDNWTSVCMDNYIAITAHFVTADFENGSFLLECINYDKSHTAENMASELQRVANDWGLADKIAAFVTDNTSIITSAVNRAGFHNVQCFAHTLNLVVQQGIKKIDDLKSKVKKIADHFRRSTVACDKLASLQQQMQPDKPVLKLLNDVTHWNSTYYVCSRVCELQEPIDAAIAVLHNPVDHLSGDEWAALQEICKVLRPFELITKEISAEKNVMVSKVIVMVQGLLTACQRTTTQLQTNTGKALMGALVGDLQQQFGSRESNTVWARATFLDPRFKRKGFTMNSDFSQVLKDVGDIITSNAAAATNQIQLSTQLTAETEDNIIWGDFDQMASVVDANLETSTIGLLQRYLEEPNIGRLQDPLIWWKERQHVYKHIVPVAIKYMCIVATSVPCERIFSKCGQLISERRSRLKPKNVQMVLFLNANFNKLK